MMILLSADSWNHGSYSTESRGRTASMGVVGFMPWITNLLPRSWLGLDLLLDERRNVISKYFEEFGSLNCTVRLSFEYANDCL